MLSREERKAMILEGNQKTVTPGEVKVIKVKGIEGKNLSRDVPLNTDTEDIHLRVMTRDSSHHQVLAKQNQKSIKDQDAENSKLKSEFETIFACINKIFTCITYQAMTRLTAIVYVHKFQKLLYHKNKLYTTIMLKYGSRILVKH